jgi:hypothetical protein
MDDDTTPIHPHGQPLTSQAARSANEGSFDGGSTHQARKLHLPVLPVADHGATPGYVSMEVTPELLARVNAMTTLCRQFSFCEISDYWGDGVWPDTDAGLPESEKLVVDAQTFYVQAYTRAGEPIESVPLSASCLLEILNDQTGRDHWVGLEFQGHSDESRRQARTFAAGLVDDGVLSLDDLPAALRSSSSELRERAS